MAQVYLAARYSRIDELNDYRIELEKRGHYVPARWLRGEHQVHGLEDSKAIEADGPIPTDIAIKFATDDYCDILSCDVMLNFTEQPRTGPTRGGRHVELGIMLGRKSFLHGDEHCPKIIVVGPCENIFHALNEIDARFNDFNGFLVALDGGSIHL